MIISRFMTVAMLGVLAWIPFAAHAASPAREMHGQPTIEVGIVLFDGTRRIAANKTADWPHGSAWLQAA